MLVETADIIYNYIAAWSLVSTGSFTEAVKPKSVNVV